MSLLLHHVGLDTDTVSYRAHANQTYQRNKIRAMVRHRDRPKGGRRRFATCDAYLGILYPISTTTSAYDVPAHWWAPSLCFSVCLIEFGLKEIGSHACSLSPNWSNTNLSFVFAAT